MAEEQESAQRKAARIKMREALEQFERRHDERAVEMMQEALEIDPDFIEPRKWLADYYASTGEHRLAVSQYETMLRVEPDNEELWEGLRAIDPGAADRLYRLHHVAPDPFVAQRSSADLDDLDDFEEDEEEFVDEEREVAAPFRGHAASDDIFLDEDAIDAAESTVESLPWDYEQDAEMRERLDQNSVFLDVLDGFELFWQDSATWRRLLMRAIPAYDAGWQELDALMGTASAMLKAPMPLALVVEEHTCCPLVLPLQEDTLVIGKPYQEVLSQQEMLFVLGMSLHLLLKDNAKYAWVADHVIEREKTLTGLHADVVKAAHDFTVGWDQDVPREEVVRLAKLAHAWEQRLVLSADRAGLLCCEDPEAAGHAIMVSVGDPRRDAARSVESFLAEFKDIPPAQLAAIGLSRDPWTDPQYAAYRIQMLRWWATTDEYKQLAHRD